MRFLVISLILWAAHGGTWYNERKRFDREGKWKCGNEALNLTKKELLNLGEQYLKIRNYDSAMKYLSRAVIQGSSRAGTKLYELGKIFYNRLNYESAFRCFQLLSDKGHGESTLLLGEMYEYGRGVSSSLQKAFDCFAPLISRGSHGAPIWQDADDSRCSPVRRNQGHCGELV